MNIQQHYQTCSDCKCPLFNAGLDCNVLKAGSCKYQTIHMLQDAYEFNQYLDGKKHGVHRVWYYSKLGRSSLREECTYKNGKEHGKYREWWNNGQLEKECDYLDGKKYGLEREWYDNGKLRRERTYRNDRKHGLEKWYKRGQLYIQMNYVNGELCERQFLK